MILDSGNNALIDNINQVAVLSNNTVVDISNTISKGTVIGTIRDNYTQDTKSLVYDLEGVKIGVCDFGARELMFNVRGCITLMKMKVHQELKKKFEDDVIKYIKSRNHSRMVILIDDSLYYSDMFFLKYVDDVTVLASIYWYLNRRKDVGLILDIVEGDKLVYSMRSGALLNKNLFDQPTFTKNTGILFTYGKFASDYKYMTAEVANIYDIILEGIKHKVTTKPTESDVVASPSISNNIKLLEAYSIFLDRSFNKDGYEAISIRIPKRTTDYWHYILPCMFSIKNNEYVIDNDRYIGIKPNEESTGDYIYMDRVVDTVINNLWDLDNTDKEMSLDLKDLELRLLDILKEIDCGYTADPKDEQPKQSNHPESKISLDKLLELFKQESLVRGKPTNDFSFNHHIHPKAFSRVELRTFKQPMGGARCMMMGELKDAVSNVSKTEFNDDVMPMSQVMYNLLRGLPFDYVDNFEFEDLYPLGYESQPGNTKYYVKDVLSVSELQKLEDLYIKYIINSSLIHNLSTIYKEMFKYHISIGVLYPELKFNYKYGNYLDTNSVIRYGVIESNVVPFDTMISSEPIDVYKDIEYKYNTFTSTQLNMCHTVEGVKVLDILQADKCTKLYKTIFYKYIELGILKPKLPLTTSNHKHYRFPEVNSIHIYKV
jgi:hypothetical protein